MQADPPQNTEPTPGRGGRPVSSWAVYAALWMAVIVASAFSTGRVVAGAEGLAYGGGRDFALAVAARLHEAAGTVALDRPAAWVDAWLGRASVGGDAVQGRTSAGGAADDDAADDGAGGDVATVAPPGGMATVAALGDVATFAPPGGAPYPPPDRSGERSGPLARPKRPARSRPLTGFDAPAGIAPPRRVSATDPLRILVAGDSFAEPLGYQFQTFGRKDGTTITGLEFKIASGLVRPDYFDWHGRLAELLSAAPPPEAVVLFLGGNDDKNLSVDGEVAVIGTPAWRTAYDARVAAVMDLVGAHGARLFWLGLPVMRSPERTAVVRDIDAVLAQAARSRPWVTYVDTWAMFADDQNAFAPYLPGPAGELERVRAEDGVHLSRAGTDRVAAKVYVTMGRIWDLAATPTPGLATPSPAVPVTGPAGAGTAVNAR